MTKPAGLTCMAIALLFASASAAAQMPSLPKGLPGGSSGPSVPGLPDISSLGLDNAAGVLGYCMKNKLLGSAGDDAESVLKTLSGEPEVEKDSEEFSLGEAGTLISGDGKDKLSLDSLPEPVREQVCDMVLKQSKSLI